MGKRDGRSPPPRTCFLGVEPLEDRCLLSALGSASEQAPSPAPATIARREGRNVSGATARTASPSSRSALGNMARSERQAGTSQQADPVEGPANTDAPGNAGQQDQQGGTGDNQSGPQEAGSPAGDPSSLLPLVAGDVSEDPGSGPAGSPADAVPNPAASSSGAGVPPSAEGAPDPRLAVVGPASGGAALLVFAAAGPRATLTFAPDQAEGTWLSYQVPQGVDGAGTPVPGRDVGVSPAAVGVDLPGRAAPGSSPQDRLVPWLAGELRGTLVVDTAVLERGLQRFLDQLNALGLPAPGQGRDPGGPSWPGRVRALLPWLGAAAAATTALELARRRLRPPAESAFPSPGAAGRWDWTTGLPGPLGEEEP